MKLANFSNEYPDIIAGGGAIAAGSAASTAVAGHTSTGTHPGANITIADAGGYYAGTTVEAALQEMGSAFDNTYSAVSMAFGNGAAVIGTGIKADIEVPFAATITAARLFADQAGDLVVDIWKDTYANYPPTDADSITAAAPPTLTGADKAQDTTLTGWTTTINAGDVLRFHVDSAGTVTRATLSLTLRRT